MSKRLVKLKDICTFINGRAYKKNELLSSGKYPVLRVGNFFSKSDWYYSDLELPEDKYCDDGDLLFAWSASFGPKIWCDGKVIYHYHIWKIELSDQIHKEYLYYYLMNESERIKLSGHGATMIHVTKGGMEDRDFHLPDIKVQKDAAKVISKVESIIKKRQEQLMALDVLIKSRFVEMFGDPKENPKGWDVVSVTDILGGKTSNGFFAKRDDYCDDGNVSVLGVVDIVNRMYSEINNLPRTNAVNKEIEKYEVKYGDMLFCRSSLVAEGIGKASIVPLNTPKNILFECHVIRLQLDLTKCVPEYVQMFTTTDYFRNQVLRHAKTSTMTTIGQDGIVNNLVTLPPLTEQQKFFEFIRHVDKLKVEVQKSLEDTQILFDSLMQKYFE